MITIYRTYDYKKLLVVGLEDLKLPTEDLLKKLRKDFWNENKLWYHTVHNEVEELQ